MICVGLMFGANAFNIGADLGAMASATQLLFPTFSFFWLVLGFTLLSLLLEIFVSYKSYSQYLKWMTFALFSYILMAIILKIDPSTLLKSALIPTLQFNKEQLILICGFFGTTISPYLFFWQSSQEVEEDVLAGKLTVKSRQGADGSEVTKMRVDVWFGMFVSNLVSFFIIVACAATLFKHGITNISSAAEAALALKPLGGQLAYLLFTIGIIGTGLLGVPVLAGSASYALSESFGWRFGLYRKLKEAYAFYGVIIISMIIGFALNFLGINPIVALLYAAVVNGIVSPIIMITIVMLSSNKKVMGRHLNGWKTKTVGWIAVAINLLVAVGTIYALFNV